MSKDFLLAVITSPEYLPGEEDYLEALLEAGLDKLHIRKPAGAKATAVPGDRNDARRPDDLQEALLQRLAPKWHARLVLHGHRDVVDLAGRYKVPQVHGHWYKPWVESEGILVSASLHSWDEVREVTPGVLEYVFLSPLFDSISKPGYRAGDGLLRRPAGVAPCKLIGLGGIDADTIGQVVEHGWDGAAVLGYIWQQPEKALERFKVLKEMISRHGK